MRVGKWAKRTAGAVLVCVALRAGYDVVTRTFRASAGTSRLAAAVADADRLDPGWRWEDLQRRHTPPAATSDGTALITQLREMVPKPPAGHDEPAVVAGEVEKLPPNQRLTNGLAVRVHRAASDNRAVISLARQFRDRGTGGSCIDLAPDYLSTSLQDVSAVRFAVTLLDVDAADAVQSGDPGRALADAHALLNASRRVGYPANLILQLVRVAGRVRFARLLERVLASAAPSDGLPSLQSAIETEAGDGLFLDGLRGERAGVHVLLTNTAANTVNGVSPDDPINWVFWWLARGRIPGDHAAYLEHLNAQVEAAKRPTHEQRTAAAAIPVPPDDADHRYSLLLLPACEKCSIACLKSVMHLRCAAAGIACERYRQREGRWPPSLAAVPQDILAECPADPFTAKPLILAPTRDGVLVKGEDAPPDYPTFRLWNPEHRGLPPFVGPPLP